MKKLFTILLLCFMFLSGGIVHAGYIWQDFDNPSLPPSGWTITNSGVFTWDWSIRCSGYGFGYGALKANMSDANVGVTWDLISPNFNGAGAGDSLIFDHAYAQYSTYSDSLLIWYSIDNGTTWAILVRLGPPGLITAPSTATPFVPLASQWATKKYGLTAGTNKLKFTAKSGYSQNLFLDNIKIGTKYNNDAGAVGFKRYIKTFSAGMIDTPKVFVRNFGNNSASFPVTVTVTPGGYTQTQSVTALAPGAIQQINFPVWTAGVNGNYTFKAYSNLTGDQNPGNDTITNTYIVTNNPHNVLVEYCTGTWCQWCPCGKTALKELETYMPNTVILAYHGASTDPWINFNGNGIISMLGMSAYPTGVLERGNTPMDFSSSGFFELPFNRAMKAPVSPVKIDVTSKAYNPGTKQLDITLNSTALDNLTGQYKINLVVTEHNLVYNQTGNTYCVGGATYVHYWVVRNMVNTAAGENLNTGGTWTNGQAISKTFTTTLGASWIDANCDVIAFVYKDGSPLNTNAEVQQSIKTPIMVTGINDPTVAPLSFELSQNFPNPFNPTTNIMFTVPKDGYASLKIYDITGKLVGTYLDEYVKAGRYNADFDGTQLASGVYFYTLIAGEFSDTKKMLMVK